jgi:microcystin-dependent protein
MKRLALLAFLSTSAYLVVAQSVPNLINYQGRLTDSAGMPLLPNTYGIQFRLWDTRTGSNILVWAQEQNVTVQLGGVFNVILGSPGGSFVQGAVPAVNDLTFAFTSSNRFLGITVVSSNGIAVPSASEILPRQQLLSVPFAIQSQTANVATSLVPDLSNALCPAGSIMAFGGAHIPAGWLPCDGSPLSSLQFPTLYSAIGTSWGSGTSGSTNNFNVPDLRGLFLRGVNGSRTNFMQKGTNYVDPDVLLRTNSFAGGNVGNLVGSLEADQFSIHSHRPFTTASSVNPVAVQASGITGALFNPSAGDSAPSTGPAGGTETRPKNAYVNYIIKY